ncbi:MAG: ATP-dependent helicase HepA [Akkermansiaceae bacterium]|jgi:ATP-dependent helicase HepA
MREKLTPGQRWVSTSEPELGLGILLEAGSGRATILFTAAEEKRIFAVDSAPILRVRFKVGDEVLIHTGETITIDQVVSEDGLLTYHQGEQSFSEGELDDSICFSKPNDRLLGGQIDELRTFNLRVESLFRSSKIRQSPVRGFLGGRVDLIPHQIAIAREVSSRLAPRVLLADEVGLGKTIEACLILHRLHLTGRAERVLIILPDPLVNQWFVELLRRFNLLFAIFDEARCRAIPGENPFLENQLILCSQEFLLENPERIPQVIVAGWDLLIVDEAHHLEWSPEEASEAYELVQALASETPSVLLLTATPQQLGAEGHFARLQLLDPHRYNDLEAFMAESEYYEQVADAIDLVQAGEQPDAALFAERSPRIAEGLAALNEPGAREKVVRDLLDSFGTGRVMFRNTRKQLSGFPERKAHLIELEGEDAFVAKVDWLVDFLKEHPSKKVLLIGKTLELVEALTEALLDRVDMKIAQFHEELTLLQRDRNAAYFSEEDGADLLICSEIGSEGRNFQFSHHLVLIDLPENPELLEQRIGRLDRIGQKETINIHVPYVKGDPGERYARWYQEGLNAFEKNLQGAQILVKRLQQIKADSLADFITESQKLRAETEAQMERGPDRLLALTSQGDGGIEKTLEQIDAWDGDREFEDWIIRLFDHFGLAVEELDSRGYLLQQGNGATDAFPNLPENGMGVTFDRERALSREEIGLMTADHPMVRNSIDLLLSSEAGNSSFGVWESPGPKSVILEAYYLVECVAPASLQTDHYLPAVPIRVAVDYQGKDLTANPALMKAVLRRGNHRKLLDQPKVTGEMIPGMLKTLDGLAGQRRETVVAKALAAMKKSLDEEKARLVDLAQVNPLIGDDEITELEEHRAALGSALGSARLRLDSLRLIYRTLPS